MKAYAVGKVNKDDLIAIGAPTELVEGSSSESSFSFSLAYLIPVIIVVAALVYQFVIKPASPPS
jgi:hypothetical protein